MNSLKIVARNDGKSFVLPREAIVKCLESPVPNGSSTMIALEEWEA
jgi:hypothetical protein